MRHIRLDQPKKSAVAEHSINAGHQIDFNNVSVLDRASGYMDRLVKEAITWGEIWTVWWMFHFFQAEYRIQLRSHPKRFLGFSNHE
jgi:hypothetical protein